jgi:hypothetical protein
VQLHRDTARPFEQQQAGITPVHGADQRRQRLGRTGVGGVRLLEAEVLGKVRQNVRAQRTLTPQGAADGHDSIFR